MKNSPILSTTLLASIVAATIAGCSSGPLGNGASSKDLAYEGPTIIDAKLDPSTIELNRDMKMNNAQVVAEVADYGAKVTSVTLDFKDIPMKIPMKHKKGTTWVADFNQKQLEKLAVSGKTMKYDARLIAKDEKGRTAESKDYLTIAVKSPDATAKA